MMRRFILFIGVVMAVVVSVSGQKDGDSVRDFHLLLKHTVPLISVEQLAEELPKNPSIIMLDTRKKAEYRVSHIKNARFVGYRGFNLKSVIDIPLETPIVVYCSLGVRSERIGKKLENAGFKNVRNLLGGMFEWFNRGHPVYDKTGRPTSRVHGYSREWSKWLRRGEKVF